MREITIYILREKEYPSLLGLGSVKEVSDCLKTGNFSKLLI